MSAEAGHILHGNPVGLEASDFASALLVAIRRQLARVYWNVNQKSWAGSDEYGDSEDGALEPLPPGIAWTNYYNWGGSPDDADWDHEQAARPNFAFEGVEFRWYKHFARSLNVNVCWPAEKWQRWFERCMQTIRAYEDEKSAASLHNDPTPYPPADGRVDLAPTAEDLRYVELMQQVDRLEAQINCIACVCIDVADGKAPRFEKKDWRWCTALDWVTRLGLHAVKAPGKLKLHDDEPA